MKSVSGATAVEFALIAPIFFALVAVFFEFSLVIFTQAVMDNATRNAARLMAVHQLQSGGSFKTQICNDTVGLVPCANVQYYVQSGSSFASMNSSIQTNAAGDMTQNGMFFPGATGQRVLVQVGYNRPTLIPWAAQYLNNSKLLLSTIAFQNEP